MLDFVMISPQLLDPFRIQHLLLICITLKKKLKINVKPSEALDTAYGRPVQS